MERAWLVSYGMAWLLAAAQALTVVSLLWVVGRIHLKRAPEGHALITDEGPEIHTSMPEFGGLDTTGRVIRGTDYAGRSLVLLLLSPECAPCKRLLRSVGPTQRGVESPPDFVVVMEAGRSEAEAYRRRYRLSVPVIVDEEARIRTGLGVDRTPYGFLIDRAAVVRMKGVVNDRGQLEGLIGRRGRYIGGLTWHEEEESAGPART
jgi:methylamine dehydrogenase accessory protein MauD